MTSYFGNLRGLCKNFAAFLKCPSLFTSVKQAPLPAVLKDTKVIHEQNANCTTIGRNGPVCVKNVSNLGATKVQLKFPMSATSVSVTKPQIMFPLYMMQSPTILMSPNIARFSTFSALKQKKKGCDAPLSQMAMQGSKGLITADDCEGVEKTKYKRVICPTMPPCLKFVRPPGKVTTVNQKRMECGRICMPCCPKARYPPVCFFPSLKKPCCKIPNPRPAFSECEKDCVNKKKICDCCHIRPPPCRLLPDIDDSC